MLPVIITASVSSIGAGFFMARVGRYLPLVVAGLAVASLATGLRCTFDRATGLGPIVGILLMEGIGIALTLQPSRSRMRSFEKTPLGPLPTLAHTPRRRALIGLFAISREEDRAVLTGLRNFLRTICGALGLTSRFWPPRRPLRCPSLPSIPLATISNQSTHETLHEKLFWPGQS
jgi:hypothetical protein